MLLTAETRYGKVSGVRSNAGFALYRGIPYAKPPVGELRWKAPEEPDKWEGTRVCDTYGNACGQFDRWNDATDDINDDSGHPYIRINNYPYPPKMSEDCLYLNIYTPAETVDDRLPVLFYIHGGGCQQWYGSDYEYCGDNFCRQGCIVVTINYRLNVFGFFVHPELARESGHDASGNYGLMDQIAALKWVYENIAAFGGDPENITVFGQSSGGRSTLSVLCSPLSEDYVRRASIQSAGGLKTVMGSRPRNEMEKLGERFMEMTGCCSIQEMRQLDWQTLRDYNDQLGFAEGFNIYPDGYVLPEETDDTILSGKLKDTEIIIGCTADEGYNDKQPLFGINMYQQVMDFAEELRKQGRDRIYTYVFDRQQPGDDAGVPHSCDNRYQFGTLDASWRPYDENDWALSLTMQKYWANFARSGDPNGDDLPHWQPYSTDRESLRLTCPHCEMIKLKEK